MTGALPDPTVDTDIPIFVNLFSAPGLAGAGAAVRLYSENPGRDPMVALSKRDSIDASCFAWPDEHGVQVRCYKNGCGIRFCGHGLLATANVASYAGFGISLLDTGQTTHGVFAGRDRQLWLTSPRVHCTSSELPPAAWFDSLPVAAATAGDASGYLVLRWPDGFDLASLLPDLEQIARGTRRAIIVTSADTSLERTVNTRYFAPQYGNDEDAVTGSAATILGDFWGRTRLTVYQRSAAGGRIDVAVDEDSVSITGNCHFCANTGQTGLDCELSKHGTDFELGA